MQRNARTTLSLGLAIIYGTIIVAGIVVVAIHGFRFPPHFTRDRQDRPKEFMMQKGSLSARRVVRGCEE